MSRSRFEDHALTGWRSTANRHGSTLVIVSGLCAILAAIAMMFLIRVRAEAEEGGIVVQSAQAQLMLMAACDYVLEASRLGYEPPSSGSHIEAFGWIDVRDQGDQNAIPAPTAWPPGPLDQNRQPLYSGAPLASENGRPAWPAIGSAAICPMFVMNRPPYATQLTYSYNPISADPASPAYLKPYLTNPDPQSLATTWNDYVNGDPTPRAGVSPQAWFRVYRESAARFIITCGAGGTRGFKDWNEVVVMSGQAQFGGDSGLFQDLLGREVRKWYRVEWSGAIGSVYDFHYIESEVAGTDQYLLHPHNATERGANRSVRSQIRRPNPVGTIRWVQRLPVPPAAW